MKVTAKVNGYEVAHDAR